MASGKRCPSAPFARTGALQSVILAGLRDAEWDYIPALPINYAVARKHLERALRSTSELAAAVASDLATG